MIRQPGTLNQRDISSIAQENSQVIQHFKDRITSVLEDTSIKDMSVRIADMIY
jgi:hypothetical protein